ncbi:MAG: hypothetical protein ACI8XB_002309 [Patiriisocius sp.]|jgi:hypothetical protein
MAPHDITHIQFLGIGSHGGLSSSTTIGEDFRLPILGHNAIGSPGESFTETIGFLVSFVHDCTFLDSDLDGVSDNKDLDSDNDGIYYLVEAGHGETDTDQDGEIDGLAVDFGVNGLFNGVETSTDSGILNYLLGDADSDGIINALDSDSDNDGCPDVIEAGFPDSDGDGELGGIVPPTVYSKGKVTSDGL